MSRSSLALAIAIVALPGCGGGGNSGSPPAAPASPATAVPKISARAYATITVPVKPPASASMRRIRRDWVSPSSESINIEAIRSDGSSESTTQGLTASTSGCTAQSNGSLTCVVPFEALTTGTGQTDEFQAETSSSNPFDLGDALSYGQSTGNVVTGGATNSFALELGGVIGVISPPESFAPSVQAGIASNVTIPISFADASSNTIEGPFDVPATLVLSGTAAGSFTITQPAISGTSGTLADPTTLANGDIILAYDGTGNNSETAVLTISSNSPQTAGNFGQQVVTVITITINAQIP